MDDLPTLDTEELADYLVRRMASQGTVVDHNLLLRMLDIETKFMFEKNLIDGPPGIAPPDS